MFHNTAMYIYFHYNQNAAINTLLLINIEKEERYDHLVKVAIRYWYTA